MLQLALPHTNRQVQDPAYPESLSANRGGAMAATTAGLADDLLLWHALQSFAQIQSGASTEDTRKHLTELQTQVQAAGLHGEYAFSLLKRSQKEWRWEIMDSSKFGMLYKFAFWICRDYGKRNLPVKRAVAAWEILLSGRFRLLDRLLAFVLDQHHLLTISEDTWRQVLDFTWSVLGDLSNYDPAGAWPVLLDEFVESVRSKGRPSSPRTGGHHDSPFRARAAHQQGGMVAMSPTAGSKRRGVDVEGVASRLAQMPLGLRLGDDDDDDQGSKGGTTEARGAALLCGAAKRLRLDASSTGTGFRGDPAALHGGPRGCRGAPAAASPSGQQLPSGLRGASASPPHGHSLSLSPSPVLSPSHAQSLQQQHHNHHQSHGFFQQPGGGSSPPPRWRGPSASATSSMSSGNSGGDPSAQGPQGASAAGGGVGSTACSSPLRPRHLTGVGLLQLPRGIHDEATAADMSGDDAVSHSSSIHQILHATVMEGLGLEE